MKPESRPISEQGLVSAVNLPGAFDHELTQTPLAKHASFSGSLVAEVSSLCISSVCLITLDVPKPNRETARCEHFTKEVVGIRVLLTRSLFACDILHRLLLRVSLAKSTSAPLRF